VKDRKMERRWRRDGKGLEDKEKEKNKEKEERRERARRLQKM